MHEEAKHEETIVPFAPYSVEYSSKLLNDWMNDWISRCRHFPVTEVSVQEKSRDWTRLERH
jgi:hypothetical protein